MSANAEVAITVRYYGGGYVARCAGQTASCTSSAQNAAERVAMKVAGVLTDPNNFPDFAASGIELVETKDGNEPKMGITMFRASWHKEAA